MIRPLLLAAALVLASAAPAVADDEPYVDLVLTAAFDKKAYPQTDDVTLTVTIRNAGTAPATGVMLKGGGYPEFDAHAWGDLATDGPGIELAPGAQREATATFAPDGGWVADELVATMRAIATEPDRTPDDNEMKVHAGLTAVPCDLTFTLFGDGNGNNVLDSGEGLLGVQVDLYGPTPASARVPADGTIHFTGLGGGDYLYTIDLPGDWWVPQFDRVKLLVGRQNEKVIRAVRANVRALTATVTLDRDRYAPGDVVRERVTSPTAGARPSPGSTPAAAVSAPRTTCTRRAGATSILAEVGSGSLCKRARPGRSTSPTWCHRGRTATALSCCAATSRSSRCGPARGRRSGRPCRVGTARSAVPLSGMGSRRPGSRSS